MARLWKGFSSVVGRKFTRTPSGVRVNYLYSGGRRVFNRSSRSTRTNQNVRLAPISRGSLQARITRAPAIKLTKFWQSQSNLLSHNGAGGPAFPRNTKVLNLIPLGNTVYSRIGNRVHIKSILLNVTVNSPFPHDSDDNNHYQGFHPYERFPDGNRVVGVPNQLGVRGNLNLGTRGSGLPSSFRTALMLVYIPRPRSQPPLTTEFLGPDVASTNYVGVGPNSLTPVDDLQGIKVIWKRQFITTLTPHSIPNLPNPDVDEKIDYRWIWDKGSQVQRQFLIPIDRTMTFRADTSEPSYSNIDQGALMLFAVSTVLSDSNPNAMQGVAISTRTAFTDLS